jgi:hypothetical protein
MCPRKLRRGMGRMSVERIESPLLYQRTISSIVRFFFMKSLNALVLERICY